MPADLEIVHWLERALRGVPGQLGVLSDAERRELLRRVRADNDPPATARAAIDTLTVAVRGGALDLTGSRRARLHALMVGLDDLGLVPPELPRPGADDDWVDVLRGVPVPAPPPAPPLPALPAPDLVSLPSNPADRLSLLRAAASGQGPPLGGWLVDALTAPAPTSGPGRLAGAAAACLAAWLLRRVPLPLPPTLLELARQTEHRPTLIALLQPNSADASVVHRHLDALLGPDPAAWGVRLGPVDVDMLLGGAALAGSPAAIDAMLAELPVLGSLSRTAGTLDADASAALAAALRGYIETSEAVTFSFGRWPDAVRRAVSDVTAARATARWIGPGGTLTLPAPHLDGVGVPVSIVSWLTHAVRLVRDAAAATQLADALRRARDVVPGPDGRPAGETAMGLLKRALVAQEQRAEASNDGRSDLVGLPEAVSTAAAAMAPAIREFLAGLAADPPVLRAPEARPVRLPPSLSPLLRRLVDDTLASERSLPNLGAAIAEFASRDALDEEAAAALARFLDGYLATWPHLRTFDYNKLARMARAARSGDPTPLCRINGVACDPGRFHAAVGEAVAAALAHIPFPQTWIPHRFGYRARQAVELTDLLAERTAQDRGPLAALRRLHAGLDVRVVATTSDLEYNSLVYAVDPPTGRVVYYMDSDGAVHAHARLPEAKHVLFEAVVDARGHIDVEIPARLTLSPRAWPLMNTYGLGDRIDVEVFDAAGADAQVEAERFQTRYRVMRGTIVGFDDAGNHRVVVDEPAGPIERRFNYEQIRGWNNPHYVPEEGGVACTVSFNRSRDSRFDADLTEMTALARAHGLPLFDLATSEIELARTQKSFLNALNAFTSRTLRYPREPAADDQDRAFHARLASGTWPMGDYLEVGRGVCRHQFVREHMGKQRAGIDERFASGAANTYGGAFRGLHIWGEVSLADRSRMVMDAPETSDARYLSDATWGDAWIPLWDGAYGNDLRRVEMYDRTRSYASMIVKGGP